MNAATCTPEMGARITARLSEWQLPMAAGELVRRLVAGGHGEAVRTVAEVLEPEAAERKERRTDRLRRASNLPPGKTFDTLDKTGVLQSALLRVQELPQGDFVDHAGNVLPFGMPGVGESHLACASGDALVHAGRSVLFTPTYQLVQQLLAARRDLSLPRALDVFDAILLDDLGYVQQTAVEAEVLFTLMAERYERRSLIITSNLVFSEWDRIFKTSMATAAAIDRLVHRATIIGIERKLSLAGKSSWRRSSSHPKGICGRPIA
jgi:DNA replication protein DnaC